MNADTEFHLFSFDEALNPEGRFHQFLKKHPKDLILAGWSLGAMLALQNAQATNIKALLLVSGAAKMREAENYPGVSALLFRSMIRKLGSDPTAVYQDFAKLCFSKEVDPILINDYAKHATEFEIGDLVSGLQYLQNTDLRSELNALDIPVCIIHGADDQVMPLSCSNQLSQGLKQATTHLIPKGSHGLLQEFPLEVAAHFEAFLQEVLV
jgi:pimeloyl-ACP methyl ester carboxylesterase